MARGVECEELLERRGVCELDGILRAASEFLETAEKQDLDANCL